MEKIGIARTFHFHEDDRWKRREKDETKNSVVQDGDVAMLSSIAYL